MKMRNKIKTALKSLKNQKARSLLTLISIAVGIATLISLMIISQSMERAVGERLGGSVDTIRVLPGHVVPGRDFVPYGSFDEESAALVKAIDGVAAVSTWIVEISTVEYNGMFAPVEIMGGDPEDKHEFLGDGISLTDGRLIDYYDARNEVVLSTSTLEHINRWIGSDFGINDTIKIGGVDATVVGIMAYDLAGIEVSHRVLMSKDLAIEISGTDNIMLMLVRVSDFTRAREIEHTIEDVLDEYFGVVGLTSAIASQMVVDTVGLVVFIVQAVVISIAVIALVVGCLGIINVMLMSVLERTREIGIMKAVGGKNKDILTLFLVEASVVSLLGGILGVVGGISISILANTIMSRFVVAGMELLINPWVLILGIVVAVVTGIIGGLYPARRAARMRPVEALRHE